MIVFKTYLKVIKQSLPSIIMYFGIFLMVTIIVGTVGTNTNDSFSEEKFKVTIINHDNSIWTDNFINYIKDSTEYVEVEEKNLKDSLFYREVDGILEIPEGYGDSFLGNQDLTIKITGIPNSTDTIYLEKIINQYLNTYNTYLKAGISTDMINNLVINNLSYSTKVSLLDTSKKDIEKANYFYNYMNYTMLAVSILVTGTIISTFNKETIKKRTLVSSKPYKNVNYSISLGNTALIIAMWFVYVIVSFIMYPGTMLSTNGLLFVLNSLVFSLMALTLGLLVGNLVSNKEAQGGITNIIALGSSFICGAFVPQEFLSPVLLKFARILPSYWYITNNNNIANLSNFGISYLGPIFINIFIMLVYTIIFIIITNVISKKRA